MTQDNVVSKHEYRKVNEIAGISLSVILPKHMCEELGIGKGTYVKIWQEGKAILIERLDADKEAKS